MSPDGPPAVVPFGLLPGDAGHIFLVETRTVATVPSGRDVLRLTGAGGQAESPPSKAGVLLVGNPDKEGGPLGKAAALRQAQRDLMKENRARFNGDSRPLDWGAWVLSGDWR